MQSKLNPAGHQAQKPEKADKSRKERLAEALRANLKRRKAPTPHSEADHE